MIWVDHAQNLRQSGMTQGGEGLQDRVIGTSGDLVIGKAKPLKPTPIWDDLECSGILGEG
jgi:hypothetical protein